jgi:hypothetical protein
MCYTTLFCNCTQQCIICLSNTDMSLWLRNACEHFRINAAGGTSILGLLVERQMPRSDEHILQVASRRRDTINDLLVPCFRGDKVRSVEHAHEHLPKRCINLAWVSKPMPMGMKKHARKHVCPCTWEWGSMHMAHQALGLSAIDLHLQLLYVRVM